MKKTALAIAVTWLLLLLAVARVFSINVVWAGFVVTEWKLEEAIPVPEGTKIPVVTILNPQNSTVLTSKNLQVTFSATTEKSNNISLTVNELYYIAGWQENRTDIDMKQFYFTNNASYPSTFSINITNVPEGPCWIQVYAVANGLAYETGRKTTGSGLIKTQTIYYVGYETLSSSTVEFTTDTITPSILSLSVENKTYHTTNVPFTLTTNEPVSQVTYSLDEQANVTVAGNTTLTDLPYGSHNIIVYATDNAGNIGTSETIYFSVDVPFPTTLIIAISVTIAVAGTVLYVYLKKRNGGQS